jgi:hypothetical protein
MRRQAHFTPRAVALGLLAVLVCVTTTACGAASVSSHVLTPRALRAAILDAVHTGHHSLHYVDIGRSGSLRVTTVADVDGRSGIRETNVRLFGQTGHFTIVVVSRTAYLRGDATAFDYFGFPTGANKYVGRWVSIPCCGQIYASYASGVTLGSFLADSVPRQGLRLRRSNTAGTARLALVGTATVPGQSGPLPEKVWLYVRSASQPLPVEVRTKLLTREFTGRLTLGPWNRPVNLHVPAHAVPISRLFDAQ